MAAPQRRRAKPAPPPVTITDPPFDLEEARGFTLRKKLVLLEEWVGPLPKTGVYEQGSTRYDYHAHDFVMDQVGPRLARLGIDAVYLPRQKETTIIKGRFDKEAGAQKEGFRSIVELHVELVNVDAEGDSVEAPRETLNYVLDMAAVDWGGDKDIIKAGTIGQKYFWVWKLHLGDQATDLDAENHEGEIQADVSAGAAPVTTLPEGLDSEQWGQLGNLAKTLPDPWKPKKVKERLEANGGPVPGFHETLAELVDAHKHACGPDCEHVQAAFPVHPGQPNGSVEQPSLPVG